MSAESVSLVEKRVEIQRLIDERGWNTGLAMIQTVMRCVFGWQLSLQLKHKAFTDESQGPLKRGKYQDRRNGQSIAGVALRIRDWLVVPLRDESLPSLFCPNLLQKRRSAEKWGAADRRKATVKIMSDETQRIPAAINCKGRRTIYSGMTVAFGSITSS